MSAEPPPSERRRSARVLLSLPCAAQRGPKAEPERGAIGNIGLQGALLRLSKPVEPGAQLTLTFTLCGELFEEIPAEVVWARRTEAGFDVGVRFPDTWTGRIQQALLRPAKQSVLIVEDDVRLRTTIEQHLIGAGYLPSTAEGLATGKSLFADRSFDLVITDLSLPDGSGMELLEAVRAHASRRATPVIILTADARMESKLAGLAFGADQYLTKPVQGVELLFCVAALLRRSGFNDQASGVINFERGKIDPNAHVVRCGETETANLSKKEFDLLYHLIAARPRILSKKYILSKLWHTVLTDNTVETHIKRIREKLGDPGAQRIVTVSGKGYKFI